MRRPWLLVVVPLLLFAMPATGMADVLPEDDGGDQIKHKGQFGLHAKIGTGYRGILRYDEEFCGDPGKDLCQSRSPAFLDLGVSYRIIEKLEVMFEVRVGLESDFGANPNDDGNRVSAWMPGVKVYFSDAGTSAFFTALQLIIDTTNYDQAPGQQVDSTDLGVKVTSGVQFDVHPTVGIYLFAAPVVSWSRWLRFELEGGLGLQARFP